MAKTDKGKKKYFGIVRLPRASKLCWISRQDVNGWSLGLALSSRTVWITGLRFADIKEVKRAVRSNIQFIHLKNSKSHERKRTIEPIQQN